MLYVGRGDECGALRRAYLYAFGTHYLTLFHGQKEPEGIMSVKFRDPLSAQACILVSPRLQSPVHLTLITESHQKMNGRFFAGRKVIAFLYAGKQRYRRSGAGEDDDDSDEKKRLDDFAQWLMAEGD